jgi:hypothetical protein
VYFVSGKSAGYFSVSDPPPYGKNATAVTETSHHFEKTPAISAVTGTGVNPDLKALHWHYIPLTYKSESWLSAS